MKMIKYILPLGLVALILPLLFAFNENDLQEQQTIIVKEYYATALGGSGAIFITYEDGKQETVNLQPYSWESIPYNERMVMIQLKRFKASGYEISSMSEAAKDNHIMRTFLLEKR